MVGQTNFRNIDRKAFSKNSSRTLIIRKLICGLKEPIMLKREVIPFVKKKRRPDLHTAEVLMLTIKF